MSRIGKFKINSIKTSIFSIELIIEVLFYDIFGLI